jgi:ribosomal protein S18 acetylase RimI-like enzyme
MSTIQYFEFTIADYEETINLWENSPGIALTKADSKKAVTQFVARNPGLGFVARDGEKLVGAVLCGNDGRRGYLYHLAVARDHRHLGIGKILTGKVLKALKEQGIQKCHIFVVADNQEGLRFWQKMGWKKREDIFVMSFDL